MARREKPIQERLRTFCPLTASGRVVNGIAAVLWELMSTVEKHQFQAEIQQLLNIVIHSLYTDKEIFGRELVSNAADALEKLRFLQSSGQAIFQPDLAPKITIETDEKENTVTITDTGIGMSNTELVENLGT